MTYADRGRDGIKIKNPYVYIDVTMPTVYTALGLSLEDAREAEGLLTSRITSRVVDVPVIMRDAVKKYRNDPAKLLYVIYVLGAMALAMRTTRNTGECLS